jgi:hypothetical protein
MPQNETHYMTTQKKGMGHYGERKDKYNNNWMLIFKVQTTLLFCGA